MSVWKRWGVAWATLLLCMSALIGCATGTPTPAAEGTPATDSTISATATTTGTVILEVPSPEPTRPAPTLSDAAVTAESGLRYEDTVVGEGEGAALGDEVTVNYSGFLTDGTMFDSSIGGQPFTFTLGAGRVIPGWEEGLLGMAKGGQRILEIPGDLAYGEQGAGMIPPNATLIFEVEMVDFRPQLAPTEVSEYETTENNVEYAILVEGSGDPIKRNDLVTFTFNAWRGDGVMFDSSDQAGRPAQFTLGSSGLAGLDEGMVGMLVGEKRQIRIPPEMAYGEEGAGEVIPPNDTIIFEIELLEVVPSPELTLADEFITTDSGLEYAILQEGEGEGAIAGDGVSVHYSGYLEDGTLFDSSLQRGQPFIFVLGQGSVIPGWDEGLVGMKKGEKRQLRIPANLAYGEAGSPPAIPANATLIFDVEMIEISPDAAAPQPPPAEPTVAP
jgi:peptidylprolyl isomerase